MPGLSGVSRSFGSADLAVFRIAIHS